MPRLPRILYAVPPTLHAHLEIAKAIRALARRIRKSGGNGNKTSRSSVQTMTSATSSILSCYAT
jgi:hypothetical protein